MFGNFNKKLIVILLFTAFTRLWAIGSIPPLESSELFWLRLLSVGCAFISVFLLYKVSEKIFGQQEIALWSVFWLSSSPWHIAESRIISPPLMASCLLIIAAAVFLSKQKILSIVIVLIGLIIVLRFSWITQGIHFIGFSSFLTNIFKYLSPVFLFFFNDTRWWVGFKEVGVFMPIAAVPFIVGIYEFFFYPNKRVIKMTLLGFLVIMLFAAASPNNPETQEFFLALPILAMIIGLGTVTLKNILYRQKKLGAMVFIVFLSFIGYQLFQMWHIYTTHYQIRVINEYVHEKNIF